MIQKPTIVTLGAGRLGAALAYLARDAGYTVAAATTSRRETAEEFSRTSGFFTGFNNVEAATLGDVILLTVPDRIIPAVVEELISGKQLRPGQILLHTSGALSGDTLAPARQYGVAVGSMHPLQALANAEAARANLSGSYFAIDGDPRAIEAARCLAIDLGGRILQVPPQERVLYHAAACIASNYLVALLHVAEQLLGRWTSDQHEALQALLPLVNGTICNVAHQGTAAALTGPISRGDASTVAQHLEQLPSEFVDFYQCLGRVTLQLADARIPLAEKELLTQLLNAKTINN